MTPPTQYGCQVCGEYALQEIAGFGRLPRVTSDSKPYPAGGRLFVCGRCAAVQKIADPVWLKETGEIYRDYEMYHQCAGIDQVVFDPATGRPRGRCEVLSQRLLESKVLPPAGKILDVGAGSGAMLAAFSATSPAWRLFGLDLDNRKEPALAAIPRFERLFTVPPDQITEQFELLTLIHSLEHFPDPLGMLRSLRDRVSPHGSLFIQVNNAGRTPFDLVVADHLCHFMPRSLECLMARAGYDVLFVRTDWVNKEISLVARVNVQAAARDPGDTAAVMATIEGDVDWLNRILEHARAGAAEGAFGIFGTSVAATWLASGLGPAIQFFVDEDPAREGRQHLGRPILRPDQVPGGATVYLAFVREVADAITARLSHLPVRFITPPATG